MGDENSMRVFVNVEQARGFDPVWPVCRVVTARSTRPRCAPQWCHRANHPAIESLMQPCGSQVPFRLSPWPGIASLFISGERCPPRLAGGACSDPVRTVRDADADPWPLLRVWCFHLTYVVCAFRARLSTPRRLQFCNVPRVDAGMLAW